MRHPVAGKFVAGMSLPRIVLLLIAALLALIIGAFVFGARRWASETRGIRSRIAGAQIRGAGVVDFAELNGLPMPVQRYFRKVLEDGQPLITQVQVSQEGSMNFSDSAEKWKTFTAEQLVVTQRPGFMWDARVGMVPGVEVRVHDSYAAGEGSLRAAVLGLITVGEFQGGKAMAEGELMRFLAEAVWYPTVLLPGHGVTWQSVDERSALATVTDGETSVTLTFMFDDEDLITSFYAAARGRASDGKVAAAPWQGRFWNYEERNGVVVPLEGEVSWVLPTGTRPYWRGRTTRIVYDNY